MFAHVRQWGKRGRRAPLLMAGLTILCVSALLGGGGCEELGLGYVGTNTCLSCHNGQTAADMSSVLESPHADTGCESCHGPGYLHVRNGGRYGLFITTQENMLVACNECHYNEVTGFRKSSHATNTDVTCTTCHDVHSKNTMRRSYTDNQLCLQCHSNAGFPTEASIEAHTFHAYDPVNTGQSRCVSCHMVPAKQAGQPGGVHNHSMICVPPISSNQSGVTPVPPNSCAGVMGCHDGTVATSPVFDVNDANVNIQLQILYDTRYGS